MNWKEKIKNAFKVKSNEIDKKKIIEEYLNSDEFQKEIVSVVQELGDEWFKIYKEENKGKNDNNKNIDEMMKEEAEKDKNIVDEFKKKYEVEGMNEVPDIIKLKNEVQKG